MKNIMITIITILLVILLSVVVMTNTGRTTRKTEVQTTLDTAVEETLNQTLKEHDTYAFTTNEEFAADFQQTLVSSLDAQYTDIKTTVYGLDHQDGLLSVKIEATYNHPNGESAKVYCERTAVIERYKTASAFKTYRLFFYTEPPTSGKDITKSATPNIGVLYQHFDTATEDSTMELQGLETDDMDPVTPIFKRAVIAYPDDPVKEGYEFEYWYYVDDSGNEHACTSSVDSIENPWIYAIDESVVPGQDPGEYTVTRSDGKEIFFVDRDMVFYAKFKKIP